MYDLVVTVAEICAVHGCPLMCLDDDGTRADADRCFHEFEVIVCAKAQIRIRMDMHVDHAFHEILFHSNPLLCVFAVFRDIDFAMVIFYTSLDIEESHDLRYQVSVIPISDGGVLWT